MSNDIDNILNQVLQESEDKQRQLIEDYIASITSDVQQYTNSCIATNIYSIPDEATKAKLHRWAETNKDDIAFKAKTALRILLQRELLEGQ